MAKEQKLTGYPSVDKCHKRGERFTRNHPFIPDISIYNAFSLLSRTYRKDPAINCLEQRVTFEELLGDAVSISNAFAVLGVRPGEIITVCMPNLYEAVAVFFAANRIGAAVTFLNEFSSSTEVRHYLNLFHSPLLLNYEQNEADNHALIQDTNVRHVITLRKDEARQQSQTAGIGENVEWPTLLTYGELRHIGVQERQKRPRTWFGGNQTALILFTSGTTGEPKAVVLTNRNILAAATYLKNSSHISNSRGEKSLVCVPFTYPYGFCTSMLMSLLCGREAILAPALGLDNISYYLSKNPNIIFGSPALLELIIRGTPEGQDLSSIKEFISGGDFLTATHEAAGTAFFRRHGSSAVMCNGSGNAETAACGTNSVGVAPRPGTVGRILTGLDAIIIDPVSQKELRYGEEGLLCVSGKNVFREYYNEPILTEKSKLTYKGKTYFITGTIGILDEDGYFTLTGREARFYITAALNKVYCDRVQSIISAIDIVFDCAVVKKPDSVNLFAGMAYIVPAPDVPPSMETLKYIKDRCKEPIMLTGGRAPVQLKPYEIPSEFQFIERLPRTKADKVDYRLLERLAEENDR